MTAVEASRALPGWSESTRKESQRPIPLHSLARRSVVRGVGGMGLRNGIGWGSHKMRGCHANHLIDIYDHDHETMHRNPGRGARVALGLVSRLQLRDRGWNLRHLWHLRASAWVLQVSADVLRLGERKQFWTPLDMGEAENGRWLWPMRRRVYV